MFKKQTCHQLHVLDSVYLVSTQPPPPKLQSHEVYPPKANENVRRLLWIKQTIYSEI